MKKSGIVVFVLSMFLMMTAFQATQGKKVAKNEDCFTITLNTKGVIYPSDPNSMEVRWRNDCTTKMDLKYAFPKNDGTWSIGERWAIAPNMEVGTSCPNATGTFRIWARLSSQYMTTLFPSDEDIRKGRAK